MSLLDTLPHSATARRRLRTSDGMGGFVDSFSEVLFSARACWKMQASAGEVVWWQQRNEDVTNKVYFAADPELGVDAVLDVEGDRYDVIATGPPDASAGLGFLWRIMVRYIGATP